MNKFFIFTSVSILCLALLGSTYSFNPWSVGGGLAAKFCAMSKRGFCSPPPPVEATTTITVTLTEPTPTLAPIPTIPTATDLPTETTPPTTSPTTDTPPGVGGGDNGGAPPDDSDPPPDDGDVLPSKGAARTLYISENHEEIKAHDEHEIT